MSIRDKRKVIIIVACLEWSFSLWMLINVFFFPYFSTYFITLTQFSFSLLFSITRSDSNESFIAIAVISVRIFLGVSSSVSHYMFVWWWVSFCFVIIKSVIKRRGRVPLAKNCCQSKFEVYAIAKPGNSIWMGFIWRGIITPLHQLLTRHDA